MNDMPFNQSTDESQETGHYSRVVLFHGKTDTQIHHPGTVYQTISYPEIVAMAAAPSCEEKNDAPAMIASTYNAHDARSHERQREVGEYVMMVADIDTGNHAPKAVKAAAAAIAAGAGFLIYSSSSATPENRKWRVIFPLADTIPGGDYGSLQRALFSLFADHGIACDKALERTGQPIYLPNVPAERRNHDGTPKFYKHHVQPGEPFKVEKGSAIVERVWQLSGQDHIERQRAEAETARRRAERAAGPLDGDKKLIDWFNREHGVEQLLLRYNYKTDKRGNWQSPHQQSGSYATTISDDGEAFITLSGSDAAAGLGRKAKDGPAFYGDAYDLFVHYEHASDDKAAWRAIRKLMPPTDKAASEEDPFAGCDADAEDFGPEAKPGGNGKTASLIVPKPFVWIAPADLPPRIFVYGRHLIAKFLSATIAPGGVGKSSLIIGEALDMVTGGKVYGLAKRPLTVWTFNGEDPEDEIQRKLTATILHYNLDPAEVQPRLYMNSGRSSELVIAHDTRDGAVIQLPVVDALISHIRSLKIDVLQIDPFVSAHRVSENDNNKIDRVAKTFSHIADVTGCAIELVHHVRKPATAQTEITADDARGASSLVSAARDVRVLNRATADCAAFLKAGPGGFEPRSFVRVTGDKANLSPPQTADDWRQIVSVQLPNGDNVGVVTIATRQDALEGVTAAHLETVLRRIAAIPDGVPFDWRAIGWVGSIIAEVTGIDPDAAGGRKRLEAIRDIWVSNAALLVRDVPRKKDGRSQKRVFSGGLQ